MRCAQRWIARTVALVVTVAVGATSVGASCPQERDAPKVVYIEHVVGPFVPTSARVYSDLLVEGLTRDSSPVTFIGRRDLAAVASFQRLQQQVGVSNADLRELAGALGSEFFMDLTFNALRTGQRSVTGRIVNTRNGSIVRAFNGAIPMNDGAAAIAAVRAVAARAALNLLCDLLADRARPVVPLLVADLTPREVSPGGTVHVNATLTDSSNGQVQRGKQIRIKHQHGVVPLEPRLEMTNDYGVVSVDLGVGTDPGPATIEVTFVDALARRTVTNPDTLRYTVLNPTGDLQARAPEPALRLGAGETLSASVTHNGSPVAGTTVSFAAEGGGTVATPSATTDANGNATTQYVAPSTNAVVDVTVTAPAPPTKGPKASPANLTASLTLVVDGGVTLNLNALDTVAGATSDVNADLVVGGTAIPGTNVTYTLSGAGALSAASAPTNGAGRASVLWLAPSGTSTADITAAAVVDGQRYTKTVTVHSAPAGGPMHVKVVPTFSGLDGGGGPLWSTLVKMADFSHPTHPKNVWATLAGSFVDTSVPDYGTTPASVPVTVRAEVNSRTWAEASVTKPTPTVAVVEASASNVSLAYWAACIELTTDSAGWVSIERDTSAMPAQSNFNTVIRPKGGLVFQGVQWEDALDATGRAQIRLDQPGKLELVVYITAAFAPSSGKSRYTLTFLPQ